MYESKSFFAVPNLTKDGPKWILLCLANSQGTLGEGIQKESSRGAINWKMHEFGEMCLVQWMYKPTVMLSSHA